MRSIAPDAAGIVERRWGDLGAVGVLLGALVVAVAAGRWVVLDRELLHLSLEPSLETAAIVAVLATICVLLLRRPAIGLVLVVGFVYLNLSQALVRFHGLPSFLQIMSLPLLIAVAYDAARRMHRHPLVGTLTVCLAGWVLVVFASGCWALDVELADQRAVETAKSFVLYALVVAMATSRARLRAVIWTLVLAASTLSTLTLIQSLRGATADAFGGLARIKHAHVYGRVFEARNTGPLGDPNFYAQILLMLAPLALTLIWWSRSRWARVLAALAGCLIVAATLLTYSRGGTLVLLAVLALTLVANGVDPKRLALAVVVTAVVLGAVFPRDLGRRLQTLQQLLPGAEEVLRPDSSIEKRKLFARVAWREFLAAPVFGVGAANYTTHYERHAEGIGSVARQYVDPDVRRYPHSLYLEIAAETGLLGLLAFGLVIAAAFTALRRARERFRAVDDRESAALVVAVAIGLLGYLLSSVILHGDFQRYLWLLFALVTAWHYLAREAAEGRAVPAR